MARKAEYKDTGRSLAVPDGTSLPIFQYINRTKGDKPGKKFKTESGFADSITIHETANYQPGATAYANAKFMLRDDSTSWHWTVDDTQAIQSLWNNEQGWHAGGRKGNQTSIGIEICVNKGGDFKRALVHAIVLTRSLRKKGNGSKEGPYQHNYYSSYRKNCPSIIRRDGLWDTVYRAMTGTDQEAEEVIFDLLDYTPPKPEPVLIPTVFDVGAIEETEEAERVEFEVPKNKETTRTMTIYPMAITEAVDLLDALGFDKNENLNLERRALPEGVTEGMVLRAVRFAIREGFTPNAMYGNELTPKMSYHIIGNNVLVAGVKDGKEVFLVAARR